MTTIFYSNPELVVALNRKIICVNPNDLQIFKEIELPEDLTKCGLELQNSNDSTTDENKEEKQRNGSNQTVPSIQQVAISPNHQLMAITTSGQKAVLLYQLRLEHAKLISVRSLPRNSSALAFNRNSECLLVTDKSGDCYRYDCVDMKAPAKLLFGHLSVVFDILWSCDEKFIITCDRDDKIRVTNYPETYDIHGYCLGHKEFVSAIKHIKDEIVVSVSGDKTIRLWNYVTGEELANLELPAPGLRLAIRELSENKYQAAVVLHQPNESVGLFDITVLETGKLLIAQSELLSLPELTVHTVCYAEKRLFVTGIQNERFTLKSAPIKDSTSAPESWINMLEDQFANDTWTPEDVSNWYKKKYDNVTAYLERKKRRMEEKEKKINLEV